MPKHPSTTAGLTAVQSYLEEEFPGHVKEASENVIAVSHESIHHHVVLQSTFLQQCPDYGHALRESELADHIREARSQGRRFLVLWYEGATRVRSTPL